MVIIVLAIMVGVSLWVLGYLYVFMLRTLVNFREMVHRDTANKQSRSVKPDDMWDEPDGTTYVQMPDGQVRLDG